MNSGRLNKRKDLLEIRVKSLFINEIPGMVASATRLPKAVKSFKINNLPAIPA
jgi:hypothetical protein